MLSFCHDNVDTLSKFTDAQFGHSPFQNGDYPNCNVSAPAHLLSVRGTEGWIMGVIEDNYYLRTRYDVAFSILLRRQRVNYISRKRLHPSIQ